MERSADKKAFSSHFPGSCISFRDLITGDDFVALVAMGRENELIQAVKGGDVATVQRLLAKVRTSKNSK